MTVLLQLSGATVRASGRVVLDAATVAVRSGEAVALAGPNGAGKSTAIRAALGLQKLAAGGALLGGEEVSRLSPRARADRAAYLPQERPIAWNLPAIEVAALGAPFLHGPQALARARSALAQVGAEPLADRGVADMSGGERARVLLARALASEAPLLLADEPIAGLDPDAQRLVLDRLKARTANGGAVLASLHDLSLAAGWADRIVVLDRGKVVIDAPPLEALSPPVLNAVFGLDGHWIGGPHGPLLAARRAYSAI